MRSECFVIFLSSSVGALVHLPCRLPLSPGSSDICSVCNTGLFLGFGAVRRSVSKQRSQDVILALPASEVPVRVPTEPMWYLKCVDKLTSHTVGLPLNFSCSMTMKFYSTLTLAALHVGSTMAVAVIGRTATPSECHAAVLGDGTLLSWTNTGDTIP